MAQFNMAQLKRDMKAKMTATQVTRAEYRGFVISGRVGGHWFVDGWVTLYKSQRQAEAAVDTCLQLRAEMGNA